MTRFKIYSIRFSKTAKKQYETFNQKIQNEIIAILEDDVAKNPLMGKPLQAPFTGLRSVRVGNLRIIYEQRKEEVVIIVVRIEHRKSVYKKMRKK